MSSASTEKHVVSPENAAKILAWLQHRGGLALWHSADLSDPGKSWTAPFLTETGEPKGKEHWQMQEQPARVITDPAEVEVHVPKEVKRFHIAIRRKGGFRFALTDGSTTRVRRAVAKANQQYCRGESHAWYEFDYDSQEAVIFVPDARVPLLEFVQDSKQEPANDSA